MSKEEISQILELVELMQDAVDVVLAKTAHISCGDDFLMSADNSFILDGVCMKLISIGESIKNIDKATQGTFFSDYPEIPWKEVMKMRDIIAHHYFRIDADVIYATIKKDLPPLQTVLFNMRMDLMSML